jgi:drug/metabolite transporter (DMT)-like permease
MILQLAVIVAVCTLFTVATLNPTILSDRLDPALVALYVFAWLGVLGGLIAPWIAWQFWRKPMSGRWASIHHILIAVSAVTLAWFFLNWNIAGTTLNY